MLCMMQSLLLSLEFSLQLEGPVQVTNGPHVIPIFKNYQGSLHFGATDLTDDTTTPSAFDVGASTPAAARLPIDPSIQRARLLSSEANLAELNHRQSRFRDLQNLHLITVLSRFSSVTREASANT